MIHNLTWIDAVGTLGTLIVVAAYFATQIGKMNSDDLAFPIINLVGSILIIGSLMVHFNFASLLMEGFWILISLMGIIRYLIVRRAD